MKKRWTWIGLFLGMTLSFMPSCGDSLTQGTDTGNPSAQVGLKIVAVDSSAAAKTRTKDLPGDITVTEARLVLSEIEFKTLEHCQNDGAGEDESEEIDFEGPFVVDLLTNTSTPNTESVTIPSGTYCEIQLKLDGLEADELPTGIAADDPIVGHSAVVRGTVEGVPFRVLVEQDDQFKLRNQGDGFEVGAGSGLSYFFVAFDLAQWTAVDMDEATLTGGVILIDKDHNEPILEQIIENIKQSSRLFKDQDGDGELDDDEDDEDDELGEGEDEDDL